jgi:hypothetical protein
MRRKVALLCRRFEALLCLGALGCGALAGGCGESPSGAPMPAQLPLGLQQQLDADILVSFDDWKDLWVDYGPGDQRERAAGVHDWEGFLAWLGTAKIQRDFVVVYLGKQTFWKESLEPHIRMMWRDLRALGSKRVVIHLGTSTLARKTGIPILWDSAEGKEPGEGDGQ